jgi:hypothetical protein
VPRKPIYFILVYGWSWGLLCFALKVLVNCLRHKPLGGPDGWFVELTSWLLGGLVFGAFQWWRFGQKSSYSK